VDQRKLLGRRLVGAQPVGDVLQIRNVPPGMPVGCLVAFELTEPAPDLAIQESLGAAKVSQPDLFVVDKPDLRDRIDQGECKCVSPSGAREGRWRRG